MHPRVPAGPLALAALAEQVSTAARRVSELARQRPGRVVEVTLKVPVGVPREDVAECMRPELERLGLVGVQVNISRGGRVIEVDTVEFEP